MEIKFNNTYAQLPESFYKEAIPSAGVSPELIKFNDELAKNLNMNFSSCSDSELAQIFSGMKIIEGAMPIALAYAGHQFGHFVPELGDGRAILLGEVTSKDGFQYDIQLKGCGQTPFSRRGDGRSWLGPVLREYIVSEAMFNMGVPTTRALAAVTTGDDVFREDIYPGGIFTRVARSHLRVGTFEYFAARQMNEEIKKLCDYAIDRHDRDLNNHEDKYNLFFERVVRRKLDLVAKWMGIGFIHGVMNTDNTSISGETLDYGPCAFMDHFSFNKVFSSIDRHGRYAYSNQGKIAIWNMSVLANTIFPLLQREKESQQDVIDRLQGQFQIYTDYFEQKWLQTMGNKLGVFRPSIEDKILIQNFLTYFEENKLDFTNSFRALNKLEFVDEEIFKRWHARLSDQEQSFDDAIVLMNNVNPYIIPRNHQIEQAIQDSLEGDFSHFHKLLEITKNPYKEREEFLDFTNPPEEDEVVHKTFCGT